MRLAAPQCFLESAAAIGMRSSTATIQRKAQVHGHVLACVGAVMRSSTATTREPWQLVPHRDAYATAPFSSTTREHAFCSPVVVQLCKTVLLGKAVGGGAWNCHTRCWYVFRLQRPSFCISDNGISVCMPKQKAKPLPCQSHYVPGCHPCLMSIACVREGERLRCIMVFVIGSSYLLGFDISCFNR